MADDEPDRQFDSENPRRLVSTLFFFFTYLLVFINNYYNFCLYFSLYYCKLCYSKLFLSVNSVKIINLSTLNVTYNQQSEQRCLLSLKVFVCR